MGASGYDSARGPAARGKIAPPTAPSPWKILAWVASNVEEIVCVALLALMVAAVSLGVFFRYVLNAALPWPEEASRFALVWVTCFGAALATKHREQIAVDFVVGLLPERGKLWMALLVEIGLIAFLVLYVILGVQIVQRMWIATSPALGMNMGYVYLSVPLGGALMIVHLARGLVGTARRVARSRGV